MSSSASAQAQEHTPAPHPQALEVVARFSVLSEKRMEKVAPWARGADICLQGDRTRAFNLS